MGKEEIWAPFFKKKNKACDKSSRCTRIFYMARESRHILNSRNSKFMSKETCKPNCVSYKQLNVWKVYVVQEE